MTEAYTSLPNNLRYYGKVENGEILEYGSQIPFNFDLITRTNRTSNALEFKQHIEAWIDGMPNGKGIHANWVVRSIFCCIHNKYGKKSFSKVLCFYFQLGNHDQRRLASRYDPSRVDVFNILLKTLPGITVTYYGEEIGMTDVFISWEDTVDPQACRTNPDIYESYSRDPARTPFQWDSSRNAGFSSAAKTWLPLATNYSDCNVELQESQENSHLKIFRQLISLREDATFKYGGLQIAAVDDDVLVYKREILGQSETNGNIFVVVLNFGATDKVVDLNASLNGIPSKLKVVVSSIHSKGPTVGYV